MRGRFPVRRRCAGISVAGSPLTGARQSVVTAPRPAIPRRKAQVDGGERQVGGG